MTDDDRHVYDIQQEDARMAAYEEAIRTVNGVRVRTIGGRVVGARWTFPGHPQVDEWGHAPFESSAAGVAARRAGDPLLAG
jgi:hypothetical protein